MISDKQVKIHLKIIKSKLIEVKENLEIIEEEPIDTGLVQYLKENSCDYIHGAKKHINHIIEKL